MRYTNNDNFHIVVQQLKENNINTLVISPGGTSIPLITAVQDDPFFTCYSVVDERSAAYFAIGLYLQLKNPVALICTSAQATRNYIPGLTEAYYKRIPVLAITMEKHPRFKYQEYMQAPDQMSLPEDCVKKSFELPYISDVNGYYQSVRTVNQAILELSKNGKGPVQLCIPKLDFPISENANEIRCIKRFVCSDIKNEDLRNKKILLVIGEQFCISDEEKEAVTNFCEITDSVVYVNHLSNYSGPYALHANFLLSTINDIEFEMLKPDILITVGGQTGDYPLYLQLSKTDITGVEHWRIHEDGEVVDTYDKMTRIYQGNPVDFFRNVDSKESSHTFYQMWNEMVKEKKTDIEVPYSNVSIAQYLHDKIPQNSIMQFSILNSLRVWNLFEIDRSIECYSNVGAFGIDGGLSTLIGQSVSTDKLSFMIIGDLAFFYDMNSLMIRHITNNVRILLINNNGGIEFKLHGEKKEEQDRYIAAADYHGSAKGWAESCGFIYLSATSMDEFKQVSEVFLERSDKPILLEAFVTDKDESAAYQKLIGENRNKSTTTKLKENIWDALVNVFGEDTVKKITGNS